MKIRIYKANTEHAYVCTGFVIYFRLNDYIDELRQHALWDTIKSVSPTPRC